MAVQAHKAVKMDNYIDNKLLDLLNSSLITSKLRVSLNIRLADYSAQLLGYRSTRQVRSEDKWNVEDKFIELTNLLISSIYRCITQLEISHKFKQSVIEMNDLDLELLLEDTLFDIIMYSDYSLFDKYFFE